VEPTADGQHLALEEADQFALRVDDLDTGPQEVARAANGEHERVVGLLPYLDLRRHQVLADEPAQHPPHPADALLRGADLLAGVAIEDRVGVAVAQELRLFPHDEPVPLQHGQAPSSYPVGRVTVELINHQGTVHPTRTAIVTAPELLDKREARIR